MTPEFRELEQRARDLKSQFESAVAVLTRKRRECRHVWDDPNGKYTPEVREAYTLPGDPPGTMGVDWRGPCYVPRQSTPRWSRTCKTCGFVEQTAQTREQVIKHPVFGGGR
jgi:hypothetical protein